MQVGFAEGRLTHRRVWELKGSAFYRTFNAMLVNESYVLKANLRLLADDILEGFPDSAILRIDIVLFCFFPYIEWLPLS